MKPPKDRSEGAVPRKLADLRSQQAQDRAAILSTILPMIQKLQDQQDQLEAQQEQLADLLTQVVNSGSTGISASNWEITTTSAAKVSGVMDVPDGGYKTALVMCVGQIVVSNSSGADQYALANVRIAGAAGAESENYVPNGQASTLTPAAIQSVDVTALSSFTIEAWVRSTAPIAASTVNTATVNAIAVFLKTPIGG